MKPGDVFNPWRLFTGLFVPNAMARFPGLSPGAKLLYGRLAQYAGKNGACYPAQDTLSTEIGVTDRWIRKLLSELQEAGFIKVERPKGRDRLNHKACRYIFLWHTVFCTSGEEGSFRSEGEGSFRSYKGVEVDSGVRDSKEEREGQTKKTSSNNPEQSDMSPLAGHSWEEFLAVMPKRNGKHHDLDACREKWVRTPALWNQWLTAARNYAASREVAGGFSMKLRKFLSEGGWKDWMQPEESFGSGLSSSSVLNLKWKRELEEDEKIVEKERQAGPKERPKPSWQKPQTTI